MHRKVVQTPAEVEEGTVEKTADEIPPIEEIQEARISVEISRNGR